MKGPPEKPHSISVSATHDKIIVSWIAGLGGGFGQHFIVYYWKQGKKGETKRGITIYGPAAAGEELHCTITGLKSSTKYSVQVTAVNEYNVESEIQSAPVAVETIRK